MNPNVFLAARHHSFESSVDYAVPTMREGERKGHDKPKRTEAKRKPTASAEAVDLHLRTVSGSENARGTPGDQGQALRRILTRLGQEKNLQTSLNQLLVAITEELASHSAALWIPDPADGTYQLYETSYEGKILKGTEQLGHPYAAKRGRFKKKMFSHALSHGLFTIPDVSKSRFIEPEVSQWMRSQEIKSLLCVPLRAGHGCTGILTIRSTSPSAFSEDREQLAQLLAHPIGLAVHLMRLAKQAEESAILEERTRIAREIHDSLAQILVEIIMRLDQARQALPPAADADRTFQLDQVQLLAREALVETQRTVQALGPVQVERRGLIRALRELAWNRNPDTQVEFSLRGEPRPLHQDTESDIFRIGQEALNNALRHARAKKVHIELAFESDGVKLTVEDDGQGFDVERAEAGGGFGLTSLRQRVERTGGRLEISSEVNGGTRVIVVIPNGPSPSKENRA